jgi:hypothetical protein
MKRKRRIAAEPARHGELDWDRFLDRHWDKAPARLRAPFRPPPVSPEDAFRAAALACAPFRAGTRFRTLPDVRFFVEDAQIRAPGTLLPGPRDRRLEQYHQRVVGRLGGRRFQLLVDQPLMVDFPLWASVRDLIAGLVVRVGFPVLPIACDLALGNFARTPRGLAKRLHHSVIALVLRGRVRVRLWERLWDDPPNEIVDFDRHLREAVTLDAEAGDILYWPARFWHVEQSIGRARHACMSLRLWVPAHGARPTDAVKEVLAELLDEKLDSDGTVPFLPFPPRRDPLAEPLARAADCVTELSRGPELTRALRIVWARRVSAYGLEPVPSRLEEARPLDPSDLVRADPVGRAVRMPGGNGEWIWAANGHAFALQGHRAAARVLRLLDSDAVVRVGELCRSDRGGAPSPGILAFLDVLHRLRAIRVVAEEPARPERGG